MAKVITQADLARLLNDHAGYTHLRDVDWGEYQTELASEWQSIDNAPRDRRVRLFYPGNKSLDLQRLVLEAIYTDSFRENSNRLPSHWQEIPADPV